MVDFDFYIQHPIHIYFLTLPLKLEHIYHTCVACC